MYGKIRFSKKDPWSYLDRMTDFIERKVKRENRFLGKVSIQQSLDEWNGRAYTVEFEKEEDLRMVTREVLKEELFMDDVKTSLTIHDLKSPISFEDQTMVNECLNVLASDQTEIKSEIEGLQYTVNGLRELIDQLRNFNYKLIGNKKIVDNVMIGFDDTKDKWN